MAYGKLLEPPLDFGAYGIVFFIRNLGELGINVRQCLKDVGASIQSIGWINSTRLRLHVLHEVTEAHTGNFPRNSQGGCFP